MSPQARKRLGLVALGLAGLLLALWLDGRAPPRTADGSTAPQAATAITPTGAGAGAAAIVPDADSSDPVARGAYLALVGNCAGCHTARGGAAYAGGRPVPTPFGMIHASNLTPDRETGLGAWSAEDFRRAMHEGRSRDGHALYPAFPYTDYTQVTRADTDALWAWLRSLPPVHAPNLPHALRFPWNMPLLLEGWRALYFRPAEFEPDASRDAVWNRGAYLVRGLGHCGACHTARDRFGGPSGAPLGGGEMTSLGWHAPSLLSDAEGGVAGWPVEETAAWLASGLSDRAVATGPMATVVMRSLQYATPADRLAMATYLRSIATPTPEVARATVAATAAPSVASPAAGVASQPSSASTPSADVAAPSEALSGERLYRRHCEDCHGRDGEGAPPHYPALAGNRTLTMASPVNTIRAVLHGGFAPGTQANPRPYGMPPFGPVLDDREVAALTSWLRGAWGNDASPVEPRAINRLRPVPVE
jgi:mono/diheme cytochrome c family protein